MPGDWVAGFLSKVRGHRFLYAMQVAEIMDLDAYFHDSRFQPKKPNLRGDWMQRCGDNFYSRGGDGNWIQHRNRFHLDEGIKAQDTKFARVYIGARIKHDPALVTAFLGWVVQEFPCGVGDVPNDNPDRVSADK